ncbi:hypothetical protein GALL_519830 [mine drainage metagenome]|uniref:Uncharacterized protein n=1 Tax=mine drainage metagenome TaxID=410659 RepID=A0A1J5P5H6_9ZZZZ
MNRSVRTTIEDNGPAQPAHATSERIARHVNGVVYHRLSGVGCEKDGAAVGDQATGVGYGGRWCRTIRTYELLSNLLVEQKIEGTVAVQIDREPAR